MSILSSVKSFSRKFIPNLGLSGSVSKKTKANVDSVVSRTVIEESATQKHALWIMRFMKQEIPHLEGFIYEFHKINIGNTYPASQKRRNDSIINLRKDIESLKRLLSEYKSSIHNNNPSGTIENDMKESYMIVRQLLSMHLKQGNQPIYIPTFPEISSQEKEDSQALVETEKNNTSKESEKELLHYCIQQAKDLKKKCKFIEVISGEDIPKSPLEEALDRTINYLEKKGFNSQIIGLYTNGRIKELYNSYITSSGVDKESCPSFEMPYSTWITNKSRSLTASDKRTIFREENEGDYPETRRMGTEDEGSGPVIDILL